MTTCGFAIAQRNRAERRRGFQMLCKCTSFKKGKNKKEKVCVDCGAVWRVSEADQKN